MTIGSNIAVPSRRMIVVAAMIRTGAAVVTRRADMRKHPLARAPAPPSRQQARLRQWLQMRASSWDLLFLSFRHARKTHRHSRPFRIIWWRARKRDGTSTPIAVLTSHRRRGQFSRREMTSGAQTKRAPEQSRRPLRESVGAIRRSTRTPSTAFRKSPSRPGA